MGFVAARGADPGRRAVPGRGEAISPVLFKAALAAGMVTASFTVEDFGVRRLAEATPEEVEARLRRYCSFVAVDCAC